MLARGTFLMLIGQASFMMSAFVINFGLGRLLGPVMYGNFVLVMSVLVFVERMVVTGIPEVMQKYGGEKPENMFLLIRKTFPWQLIYTVGIFGFFWFVTPFISSSLGDRSLTIYIHVASFDIIFYGLYIYYLGIQNGLHRFHRHSLLMITYSISKMFAVFGLVLSGLSVNGALIGNVLGSICGLVVGLGITRLPKIGGETDRIPYLKFVVPNILYFMGLYLFFCIDLWFVKYYLNDFQVGYYASAAAISKVPYSFSLALSAALLPSISHASRNNDQKRVQTLVNRAMHYLFIALVLLNLVFWAMPVACTRFVFGSKFLDGSTVLVILGPALSFVTLFAVMNTVLMARNKMQTIFRITFVVILIDLILNAWLVPKFALRGAAFATLGSALVGVLIVSLLVYQEIKALFSLQSLFKIVLAALLVFFFVRLIPDAGLWFVVKGISIAGSFFILLLLLKDIGKDDFWHFRQIFSKGR